MNSQIWDKEWRQSVWTQLDKSWDLLIIGGGITGAGILREAVRSGLKCLLVEERDFASGASSRSSKLVHGGLRYLKNGQFKTTFESVRERERLQKEGRGLIKQLGFLHAHLQSDRLPGWMFGAGLCVYDILAGTWLHRHYDEMDMRELCRPLTTPNLIDGYRFFDAITDDARLVMRVLREASREGGIALNYCRADKLLKKQDGTICGAVLNDRSGLINYSVEVKASIVINATGSHCDILRKQAGGNARLRPLRGSHLVIKQYRLPITRAVSFAHPFDQRPIYALPWENATIFGTTDVDHPSENLADPVIDSVEWEYLFEGLNAVFPEQRLNEQDVISTFSGIRPTINTETTNPSKISRDYEIHENNGMITVSGGKLTTFRLMALDTLKRIAKRGILSVKMDRSHPILDKTGIDQLDETDLTAAEKLRICGRYGRDAQFLFKNGKSERLPVIETTPFLWSELKWATASEGAVHLEDILLRRIRIGLLLPKGGEKFMQQIRAIVQPEMEWNDSQWDSERSSYMQLWKKYYSPAGSS
tara:strand:- start:5668 stop:7269 length:1602 start_codon:yes stop_codon:yes gene_type:complete